MDSVNTDNITSGPQQESASGPLARLPIEWLVQVIQWLPLQFIFTIMCVNREWQCACRYVVKWRSSLDVYPTKSGDDNHIAVSEDWSKERLAGMVSSLKQMKNLTTFRNRIFQFEPFFIVNNMDDIIFQNAATLKSIVCYKLPDDGSISYPLLHQIDCDIFDASSASRLCPSLETLFVKEKFIMERSHVRGSPALKFLKQIRTYSMEVDVPADFLREHAATLEVVDSMQLPDCPFPKLKKLDVQILPANESLVPALEKISIEDGGPIIKSEFFLKRITKLRIISEDGQEHPFTIEEAAESISQMTKLKTLFAEISVDVKPDHLIDPFMNLHGLKDVSIYLPDGTLMQAKSWASSLFRNNPQLIHVELSGIPVTDEDLLLCSQLSDLYTFKLVFDRHLVITITGILNLLRGKSRHEISECGMTVNQSMVSEIESEFDAIEKERKVVFTKEKGFMDKVFVNISRSCPLDHDQ
jgi:hypothetical protein